ncbi:MAG: hypothetical protein JWN01_1244 [Patescibacteria group bacterium]|nr:hypothetical protein [Patescibacteria group bacterium]
MRGVTITSRPIRDDTPPFLLVQDAEDRLQRVVLEPGEPLTISYALADGKRCVGWYDISTHKNHICDGKRTVDIKFDSCFECRKLTGFNPAFYNTDTISDVQAAYNRQPHSVYIAYFGNGLAKAGIMSDSRGLERLYEQGALLYVILGSFANATAARDLEAALIGKGMRNSVTKKQKEAALRSPFDIALESRSFDSVLRGLGTSEDHKIVSNMDHFFFGAYRHDQITPIAGGVISGTITGAVGRYLVLENQGRLYGYWLNGLSGYTVTLDRVLQPIQEKPLQSSLF